jgi:hypothetical protein
VALVRTDVTEKGAASFITVTIIDELGTTLAVTNNHTALLPRKTEFIIVTAVKTTNLT